MKKRLLFLSLIVVGLLVLLLNGLQAVLHVEVADAFPMPGERIWVPVLVYHRIGYLPKNASSNYRLLTVAPEWFDKQLKYLRENGFHTINYSDLADFFETGRPLPKKPVMINFDDGYKDFYTNALPIIKKYDMTATVFMIAGYAGYPAYLNWDQIKESHSLGIEIGSHTMNHQALTKAKDAKWQLVESKRLLEEHLGAPITAFAYPYGNYNQQVETMVKAAGYTTARSFSPGDWISQDNLFHIWVIQAYGNAGLERFTKHLVEPKP